MTKTYNDDNDDDDKLLIMKATKMCVFYAFLDLSYRFVLVNVHGPQQNNTREVLICTECTKKALISVCIKRRLSLNDQYSEVFNPEHTSHQLLQCHTHTRNLACSPLQPVSNNSLTSSPALLLSISLMS